MLRLFSRLLLALILTLAFSPVPAQETPAAGTLGNIRSRGSIRVGFQRDFHPFHIQKARSGFPGIDVELAAELGRALRVRVDPVYRPLTQLLAGVAARDIDVSFGAISSNLVRARDVSFVRPYLITSPAGLLNRDTLPAESGSVDFPKRSFQGLADLKYLGKLKIGVRADTSNSHILKGDPFFRKHNIVEQTGRAALLGALRKNNIDLLVADRTYLKALLIRHPGLRTRFVFLHTTYREEHLSPVVPRGDAEFQLYMDFFVKEMNRIGMLERLRNKYFESDDWIP